MMHAAPGHAGRLVVPQCAVANQNRGQEAATAPPDCSRWSARQAPERSSAAIRPCTVQGGFQVRMAAKTTRLSTVPFALPSIQYTAAL